MLISEAYANLMDANISKAHFNGFKLYPDEYKAWCDVRSSKKDYEQEALFGEVAMPNLVGAGENFPETSFPQGPKRKWTHVKYGHKLVATEELLGDEKFPVLVKTASALGVSMKHRMNTQGAYDLNMSFTNSTVGASDTADETLCDTAHASFGDGEDQANRPAVDITLGVGALWAGINNFSGLEDREGDPIMKIPRKVVINAANERRTIELLQSAKTPQLASNETNAIRNKGLTYEIGHYLTSSTAWWLSTEEKSIIFYVRWPVKITAQNLMSNQSREWYISVRISTGPLDWYDIYGTDGV